MHYYKRNIGDYAKKAGRLSILQHGVYNLLIDACYDRERFPTREEASDWVWASTPEEEQALDFVLRKFFALENGVYVQARIAEEIAEYQQFCRDQAEKGKRGGRPKKKPGGEEGKPNGFSEEPNGKQPESKRGSEKTLTTNQEPLTTNQEPNSIPFEDFWKSYPRRDAKKDARKAWDKLKPTADLFALITEDLEKRRTLGVWDNPKFIPLPATYLNGARWDDEVLPPGGNPHATHQPNRRESLAERSARETAAVLADIEARENRDCALGAYDAAFWPQVGQSGGAD